MLPLEPVEPQICPSGTDIKEFQAERDNIRNFMLATSDGDSEHLRNCLLLEEECIRYIKIYFAHCPEASLYLARLRKSEQELRQKLLLASTTEQDLKSSINRLQEELNAQKAQNVSYLNVMMILYSFFTITCFVRIIFTNQTTIPSIHQRPPI